MTAVTVGLPVRRIGDGSGFGDRAMVADAVRAAEELGFWGLTAPDHVIAPAAWAKAGGGEAWIDPFVLLAHAAALTTRLRLVTHVVVLPYRNPFAVAKAVASLDHLSGGRAVLGVGSGYLREEFDILGVPFEERGARTDEYLRIVRACLTAEGDVEFAGRFFRVSGARMAPRPAQRPRPPIWIGGNSLRAVRRAVELGDCWAPFDVTDDHVRRGVGYAERLGRAVELALPLGRVQRNGPGLSGAAVAARARALVALGAGTLKCGIGGRSPRDWFANLEWAAAEIGGV